MGRETIRIDDALPAVADHRRATVTDGLVFTIGRTALTPDGRSPTDEPVDVRAGQVLENLEAVLSAADSGLDSATETTMYFADIDDHGAVNEVNGESFDSDPPARSAVEAGNLPPGTAVEIGAVATGA